ncbi:DUF3152 domain-containing protein [Streptomyces sp. NPDC017248]|uniref:DUF3152 domain-containing protein n=1 Tax=unclassified Streptomyces TaxID=2593676 RepID=UPI0037B79397
MGRHSRRGPAPKAEPADITAPRDSRRGTRQDSRQDTASGPAGVPAPGAPGVPAADPAAVPGVAVGASARRVPGASDGTPARGVPRPADGGPAHGAPRSSGGAPAQGTPRPSDGGAVRGVPGSPDGTPARGVPRSPDDASPDGASVRGAHPEQREAGGGWGEFPGRAPGNGGPGVVLPRQRRAGQGGPRRGPGPRQEYLDAFERAGARDAGDGDARDGGTAGAAGGDPAGRGGGRPDGPARKSATAADGGASARRGGTKGWAFTGIAAAAVTTVLAVIVAGQVTKTRQDADARSGSAAGQSPGAGTSGAPTPSAVPSQAALTYGQKMSRTYPLAATLTGPGTFDAVPGFDKAPGTGQKYRYRVDVERGLGLDGVLFAEAVQKTLNDGRSWAHGGARTFERVSSGKPDFVITLASPGTTAKWCAKSGLDTTEDNVSCDSAATERVMINAYRWAQGSKTYGDRIHAYRQMLINHEVGHRLGHGHVMCQKDGELAPVMQQQTKFLDHDGIHCRPNPWPYPGS